MAKDPARPLNAELLARLMKEADPPWNKLSLGKRLGVADTTVRAWLEGAGPNGGLLVELCRLLGVTPWEMYGYLPTKGEAIARRIDRLPRVQRDQLFAQVESWVSGATSANHADSAIPPSAPGDGRPVEEQHPDDRARLAAELTEGQVGLPAPLDPVATPTRSRTRKTPRLRDR